MSNKAAFLKINTVHFLKVHFQWKGAVRLEVFYRVAHTQCNAVCVIVSRCCRCCARRLWRWGNEPCAHRRQARVGARICDFHRFIATPDRHDLQFVAEVLDRHGSAQFIESQSFDEVVCSCPVAINEQTVIRLVGLNEEIEQELALRGQKSGVDGMAVIDEINIIGNEILQKRARISSTDTQHPPLGEDRCFQAHSRALKPRYLGIATWLSPHYSLQRLACYI